MLHFTYVVGFGVSFTFILGLISISTFHGRHEVSDTISEGLSPSEVTRHGNPYRNPRHSEQPIGRYGTHKIQMQISPR